MISVAFNVFSRVFACRRHGQFFLVESYDRAHWDGEKGCQNKNHVTIPGEYKSQQQQWLTWILFRDAFRLAKWMLDRNPQDFLRWLKLMNFKKSTLPRCCFQRFLFLPHFSAEMIQFDLRIFFKWVVQPPTSCPFRTWNPTNPKPPVTSGKLPSIIEGWEVWGLTGKDHGIQWSGAFFGVLFFFLGGGYSMAQKNWCKDGPGPY